MSKARVLRRIVQRSDIDFSQVIYVGDETRDIDASKQVGILVAAVTWGFSSREALATQRPAFLIDHPRQLLGAAQTWSTLAGSTGATVRLRPCGHALVSPGRVREE